MYVSFEGVVALDGLDLQVKAGEIVGLIGPNGAGKTTLVNVITGFQRPSEGRVFLNGDDVTARPPHVLGRLGLCRTFQGGRLFGELTVAENVEVAALVAGHRRSSARAIAQELLARMNATRYADAVADSLPYGVARRVAIARSLAADPTFLLLDEPAAGLDEGETQELASVIREIRGERDLGILVIEHDMALIMSLCERIQVIGEGRTISVGTPAEIQQDPRVLEAYLGSKRQGEHA